MKRYICRWILIDCVILGLCVLITLGQETKIRSSSAVVKSVLVMTDEVYDSKKIDLGTYYNILHIDQEKAQIELAATRPTKMIHIWVCGNNAGVQQRVAEEFAPYADVFSYMAFLFTSHDRPVEGEMIWGNLDNPFINHARKMRQIIGEAPIIACLSGSVNGRSISLEEIQWQFIASLGCGYRGVVWHIKKYSDVSWGEELKKIEVSVRNYGHYLALAKPVAWVRTEKDQPITALACEKYLFVFLLNKAYMKPTKDGKFIFLPIKKSICEGIVVLAPPEGLKICWGRTLDGNGINVVSKDSKIISEYSFTSGGEMLIFSLDGRIKPAALVRPTKKLSIIKPIATEDKQ